MSIKASFRIPGVVEGVRLLKTTKDQKPFAVVLTIAAFGGSYEVQSKDVTREAELLRMVGSYVEVVGGFEMYDGSLRLQLSNIAPATLDLAAFKAMAGDAKGAA